MKKLSLDKAIRILSLEPGHNDSTEEFNEACRMGMEALKYPLLTFIKQEVAFRLEVLLGVPAGEQTPELIEEIVNKLYDENDVIFNYDALDSFLIDILDKKGVNHN